MKVLASKLGLSYSKVQAVANRRSNCAYTLLLISKYTSINLEDMLPLKHLKHLKQLESIDSLKNTRELVRLTRSTYLDNISYKIHSRFEVEYRTDSLTTILSLKGQRHTLPNNTFNKYFTEAQSLWTPGQLPQLDQGSP